MPRRQREETATLNSKNEIAPPSPHQAGSMTNSNNNTDNAPSSSPTNQLPLSQQSQQTASQSSPQPPALPDTTPLWCDKHPEQKCITTISQSKKNPNREFYRCTSTKALREDKYCCFKGWTSRKNGTQRGVPRCWCEKECELKEKPASDKKDPSRMYFQCKSGKRRHMMLFAEPPTRVARVRVGKKKSEQQPTE